jgi:hypothetical protein
MLRSGLVGLSGEPMAVGPQEDQIEFTFVIGRSLGAAFAFIGKLPKCLNCCLHTLSLKLRRGMTATSSFQLRRTTYL